MLAGHALAHLLVEGEKEVCCHCIRRTAIIVMYVLLAKHIDIAVKHYETELMLMVLMTLVPLGDDIQPMAPMKNSILLSPPKEKSGMWNGERGLNRDEGQLSEAHQIGLGHTISSLLVCK